MKKLLLLSATVCLFATNAYSKDITSYIEGRVSQNYAKAEYKEDGFGKEKFKDNVFGGSIEIGAKLDQFRVGLEGYYNDKMDDKLISIVPVKGETKGLFLNAYYDIPVCERLKQVKPYVGIGIGYSWLKETVDLTAWGFGKDSLKDRDWGWNVGLGVAYGLNDNVDLTLGYRYEDLGKIKDYDSKTDFTNHKVSLGLRYTF